MADPKLGLNVTPALLDLKKLVEETEKSVSALQGIEEAAKRAAKEIQEDFQRAAAVMQRFNNSALSVRQAAMADAIKKTNKQVVEQTNYYRDLQRQQTSLQFQSQKLQDDVARAGLLNAAALKEKIKTDQQALTSQVRLDGARKRGLLTLGEVQSEMGRSNARIKESIRGSEQLAAQTVKQAVANQALKAQLSGESADLRRINVDLKEQLKTRDMVSGAQTRQAETLKRANQAYLEANTADGKLTAQMKERARSTDRLSAQTVRMRSDNELLEQQLSGEAQALRTSNVELKERLRTQDMIGASDTRQAENLARLRQQQVELATDTGRLVAIERELLRGKEQLAVADTRLSNTLALERNRRDQLSSADGREAVLLREQNAEAERAIRVEAQRSAKLRQLKSDLDYLRSAEGRRTLALQESIRQERKAILASTKAHIARNGATRLSNQLTASMRAGLIGLRTSIGMYTSSTIIAASATYALTAAIRSTITVGGQFTDTMDQVQGILGVAPNDALFKSLVSQVRMLGQTTQFTASQVGDAAKELALIGLSESQILAALKPTLDLAIIGNIELGESAKLATDVMLVFGKQASDLTNVIDILAKASAASSATVGQLTNAISYAGPAAHAVGITLKDLTSAVGALANQGIRGSRAGTTLRRLFARMAEPTAKGAKMLEKYNIHLFDLEGNARSLTDILSQLSHALEGVGGQERLDAITDLVGVRASSGVVALVNNLGSFEKLRAAMELVDGAAAKMTDTFKGNLPHDIKNLVSAFEELQHVWFSGNEFQLRLWTQQLTDFTISLTDLNENGIPKIQELADRFIHMAEAAGAMLGALALGSLNSKFNGLSGSLFKASNGYAEVAASARGAAVSLEMNTRAAQRQMAIMNALSGVSVKFAEATAARYTALAAGLATTSRIITATIGGITRAVGFLSGVGTIIAVGYGLYQLLDSMMGSVDEDADALKAKIAGAKAEYDELYAQAQARQKSKSITTLNNTLASTRTEIEKTKKEIETLKQWVADSKAAGEDASVPEAQLYLSQNHLKQLNIAFNDTTQTLDKMRHGYISVSDAVQNVQAMYQRVSLAQEKLNNAMQTGASPEVLGQLKEQLNTLKEQLAAAKQLEKAAEARAKGNTVANTNLEEELRRGADIMNAALPYELRAVREKETKTSVQGFIEQRDAMLKAQESAESLAKAMDTARTAGNKPPNWLVVQWVKDYDSAVQDFTLHARDFAKNVGAYEKGWERLYKAQNKYDEANTPKAVQLSQLRAQKKAYEDQIATFDRTSLTNADGTLIDPDKRAEVYESLDKVNQRIKALTGSTKDQLKAEKDLMATFTGLQQKFDPVAASEAKMAKAQSDLNTLHKQGKISAEDLGKALDQLAKDHAKVVIAADKQYQAVKKLGDAYFSNSLEKAAEDLAALTKAQKENNLSTQQAAILRDKITRGYTEYKGPTVSVSRHSDGAFSDVTDTALAYTAGTTKILEDRGKAHDDLMEAQAGAALERDQALHEARLAGEEVFQQKKQAIMEKYQADMLPSASWDPRGSWRTRHPR